MENERVMLEQRMETLLAQSRDAYFSEYLAGMLSQLRNRVLTVEYVSAEVNRAYAMYVQRMQAYDAQLAAQAQAVAQEQTTAQAQEDYGGKRLEFALGAGVLSVVGILFILTAFVMLGMTYMSGMLKGMCLYVIALAILLFSELFLTKKMPKFAIGITGLGICGLYLATLLNSLYLENFNGWVAMAAAVAISASAVLLSRKRDSGTIKIISFTGCYICIFLIGRPYYRLIGNGYTREEIAVNFLVTAAIVFIVNVMTVFLPVKKNRTAVHIFQLVANMFFSLIYACAAEFRVPVYYVLFFLVSALLTQGLIFYCLERPKRMDMPKSRGMTAGNIAVYAVSNVILLFVMLVECGRVEKEWYLHGAMGAFLAVCILLLFLFGKSRLKWIQYWMFCGMALTVYHIGREHHYGESFWMWSVGIYIGVFLAAKLLSRVKILRSSELVITIFAALEAVIFFGRQDLTGAFCFLGAFLLSIAALYYWKSLYEGIFLAVLEAFILINFQNELTVAVMLCILFAGIIGFNSIAFFRGQNIRVFNYAGLGCMGCLYLLAAVNKNTLAYTIMLVLGIAFMLLAFCDKYGMNFKIKNLIFIFFLCYMTLIWEVPLPVVKSIILMIIAIGAVIAGFVIRQRRLRMSGLLLALAVSAKLVLWDFPGAATTEKMLLFLIAGLIVLAISGIYIALEKKIV